MIINKSILQNKTHDELVKLATATSLLTDKRKYNFLDYCFPEKGQYRADLYPKHIHFMNAGGKYNLRAFIAANRVGKSFAGAYEMVCHLTGRYPAWWKGKRFTKAIKAWACAIENKQLREGIQELLFGAFEDKGTGLIPK